MKLRIVCVVVGFLSLALSLAAQTSGSSPASAQVPPLIQFSNVATDEGGNTLSGVVSITFSLYSSQQGGEPLWTETQNNVQLDSTGHYSVQLGITQPNGVPTTLFTTGEARWLGVQIAEQVEQPRVLLLSVPYALKAGDAATIGGLPPSAFVLAAPPTANAARAMAGSNTASVTPATSHDVTTTDGTVNTIPLFTTATNIQNSILTQTGTTAVNVGGNLKLPALGRFELGSKLFAFGSYTNGNALLGFAGNTTMTGTYNTATGLAALSSNTTGIYNVASGVEALQYNTTGSNNTASGTFALAANTTGYFNTASGSGALQYNTTGYNNTASGSGALYVNTLGSNNVAVGTRALYQNVGDSAGDGWYNTAVGNQALYWNNDTSGTGFYANYNVATGYQTLYSNTTGLANAAVGFQALYSNTTGPDNTASGYQALYSNTTGSDNAAFGYQALYSNTTEPGNDAFGYQALYSNTTGNPNDAFGYLALYRNTTGYDNAAFGAAALTSNTTGFANTAFGEDTLQQNSIGYDNAAFGQSALFENTTGYGNTAVGFQALFLNATGSDLTCIGYGCTASDALTNATAIGAHAVVGQSNSLVLGGTGDHAVKVGIGTTAPSNVLTVGRGTGHPVSDSWETYSSRRWKTNIHPLQNALSKVEQLRGVSYDLKDSGKHEIGVIAEEVGQVVPEVVSYEKNGKDATGVDYSRLTALLIEATKEQQREIQHQQTALRTQAAAIRDLKSELRATRQTLQKVKAQVAAAQPALVAAK